LAKRGRDDPSVTNLLDPQPLAKRRRCLISGSDNSAL
jgi:hypothetical protein